MKLFNKNLIFILLAYFSIGVISTMAQDTELETDSSEFREVSLEKAFQDSTFVLEANSIRGRYNFNNFVSPTTNFIKVNGENIIIQTANDFSIGYNGLGGITIEGTIRDYEIDDDSGRHRVVMQINSNIIGFSTVTVSSNDSGNASADVRTGFGNYINFRGTVYPLANSRSYEGNTIF